LHPFSSSQATKWSTLFQIWRTRLHGLCSISRSMCPTKTVCQLWQTFLFAMVDKARVLSSRRLKMRRISSCFLKKLRTKLKSCTVTSHKTKEKWHSSDLKRKNFRCLLPLM
jgi:hypothetical protein